MDIEIEYETISIVILKGSLFEMSLILLKKQLLSLRILDGYEKACKIALYKRENIT
jgi:hypothetical protein